MFALTDWLWTSHMHSISIPFWVGGAVASWLAPWLARLRCKRSGFEPWPGTLPLSTQVYKLVPANCCYNLTNCSEMTWDGLASRPAEVCYRNRDKFRQLWAYLAFKASHFSELKKTLNYWLVASGMQINPEWISWISDNIINAWEQEPKTLVSG